MTPTSQGPFARFAQAYAALGVAVFPLKARDKIPVGGHGCKDATTDKDAIQAWAADRPNSNIGLATGRISGFWVLDLDTPEAEAWLAAKVAVHGDLPPTPEAKTARGRHLFFMVPDGREVRNSAGKLAPGVDVRGEGGYVVGAPSMHPSGVKYEWRSDRKPSGMKWAMPPAWLLDAVSPVAPVVAPMELIEVPVEDVTPLPAPAVPAKVAPRYVQRAVDGELSKVAAAGEGGRNHALNEAAFALGQFVGGGYLEAGWLRHKLLQAATSCGLVGADGIATVNKTIDSGMNAGIAKPRQIPEADLSRSRLPYSAALGKSDNDASHSRTADPSGLLRYFNDKYAVVNEGGKTLVLHERVDDAFNPPRKCIERITFDDFKKRYLNMSLLDAESQRMRTTAGAWWLKHPSRRQYLGGVVFDPQGLCGSEYYNLWRGWAVKPQVGDWSRLRGHALDVICNGDADAFEYLLNWLARMFQQPWRQGEVAVVLRGGKGTGKGTLGNALMKIIGQHSIHISNAKHLVGNFNGHLRDAVFIFADEAFFAGDRQHEGVLKSFITEPQITVEAKYQNAVSVRNVCHVLMASNSDWVVPASADERRYFVLEVSDERQGDREYFSALNREMEAGGLAAMLYDLLARDIRDFDVRKVPQTVALMDQKRLSMDTQHRWLVSVLERGFVYRSRHGSEIFTRWEFSVTTALLVASYQQWAVDNRVSYPMSSVQIGKFLTRIFGISRRSRTLMPVAEVEQIDRETREPAIMKPNMNYFYLGDLHEARAAFANRTGFHIEGAEPDVE